MNSMDILFNSEKLAQVKDGYCQDETWVIALTVSYTSSNDSPVSVRLSSLLATEQASLLADWH